MTFVQRVIICLVAAIVYQSLAGAQPLAPLSVPKDAFWVGGPDGGVFATITPGDASRQFRAEIYSETGALLYSGPLYLDKGGPTLKTPNDPNLYNGWDGEEMLLSDGRKLRVPRHTRPTPANK
jgi:hypothetical protein